MAWVLPCNFFVTLCNTLKAPTCSRPALTLWRPFVLGDDEVTLKPCPDRAGLRDDNAANNPLVLTKWTAWEMKRRKCSVDKSPAGGGEIRRLRLRQRERFTYWTFPASRSVLPVTAVVHTDVHHWELFYIGTDSLQSSASRLINIILCFIDFWVVGFVFLWRRRGPHYDGPGAGSGPGALGVCSPCLVYEALLGWTGFMVTGRLDLKQRK